MDNNIWRHRVAITYSLGGFISSASSIIWSMFTNNKILSFGDSALDKILSFSDSVLYKILWFSDSVLDKILSFSDSVLDKMIFFAFRIFIEWKLK